MPRRLAGNWPDPAIQLEVDHVDVRQLWAVKDAQDYRGVNLMRVR
jgi:hypothetical protein